MRRPQALALVMVMLLLAACTAARASTAAPRGAVAGRLMVEGGPPPLGRAGQQPRIRPIPGTVQLISSQHQRITVRVNASGRFSLQLPAGRYEVLARSPDLLEVGADGIGRQIWSSPVPVVVIRHHTTKIPLTMIVP